MPSPACLHAMQAMATNKPPLPSAFRSVIDPVEPGAKPDTLPRRETHMIATDIECSALEIRAEAEEHMAEAMRILNAAIRRTHKAGLAVDARILSLHSAEGVIPQLSLSTVDRQRGAI